MIANNAREFLAMLYNFDVFIIGRAEALPILCVRCAW